MIEYTTIWQPLIVIFISFSIGMFFGSLWMFFRMSNDNQQLEKELDSKTRLLEVYEEWLTLEDDGHENY
tara:strand:+ start:126 stop:332 length:207 start_codon:yes stop_codon:yes gene_type:complete